MGKPDAQCWAALRPTASRLGLAQRPKRSGRPGRASAMQAHQHDHHMRCSALALARLPAAARPTRGGGAGEVSTMGLRRRRGARFRGEVLTEATIYLRGGGRRPSAAMFQAGGGERWPVVTWGRSCDSVKARRW
jgi:hypothetical protein